MQDVPAYRRVTRLVLLPLCLTLSGAPNTMAHDDPAHDAQARPAPAADQPDVVITLAALESGHRLSIQEQGQYRVFKSNGLPNHDTGRFPNRNNPNRISTQSYSLQVPLNPSERDVPHRDRGYLFGLALSGVPFDPGTAEYWNRDRSSGWRQEAILANGRKSLGLDAANAHVQPNGAYHYHGPPETLIRLLAKEQGRTSQVLIGYAADGFPIYNDLGPTDPMDPDSPVKPLVSSYRLKAGQRPGNGRTTGPGGAYTGTYTRDYEFAQGFGDLDACNGRFGVTPQYPEGIYHYVLTDTFPFIPRQFKGTPDPSFQRSEGPRGARPGTGSSREPRQGHPPPRRPF